jgi:DNA repair photolyase
MEFIPAKNIVSGRNTQHQWFGVDYNMNIYKGCCHGCIYCDSRSECYQIKNFDTVRAKANALNIIDKNLASKRITGVVGSGGMSDPYNPFEEQYELTRGSLKLLDQYGFGCHISTKSDLVLRDIDILKSIMRHSPVLVMITITCADDALSKIIEPNVNVSSARFNALKTLSDHGIPCGVLLMPILPMINDTKENIASIVEKTAKSGAKYIFPAFGMTLRSNQRDYYYKKIDQHFAGLSDRYVRLFGDKYSCGSQKAGQLWHVFKTLCEKHDIAYKQKDIAKGYKSGYVFEQLSWF